LKIDAFSPPSEIDVVGVKYPVFSSHALPEIDQTLGANMKSTGEGLCLGKTVEEALYKVFEGLHEAVETGGTVYIDSDQKELKQYQTSTESSFSDWIKTSDASVYFSHEETDEMKNRRIAALEAGITVLTEAETLLAFIRSMKVNKVNPIPLTQSKSIQGVSRV
jgi:carbamoyl-phosphate synthase large subunit